MNDEAPPKATLKRVRTLLWVLVALAIVGVAALLLVPRAQTSAMPKQQETRAALGGPFTLISADGKPFSSQALAGKPYAIFFGFTRCGDVCPTTLGRLARLREQAGGDDAFNIVFVTIDPANDGPQEVGQYAALFDTPIIGLTGSVQQIGRVKRQYGIFAEPNAHAANHGEAINHTSTVLLFDRKGQLAGTISANEPDNAALPRLKALIA